MKFPNLVLARGVAVDDAGNVYASELTNHSPGGLVLKLSPGQTTPVELPGERTRKDGLDRTFPDQELAAIGSRDTSGQGLGA